jgi:serine/threonine protein phosphatase PrpC
VRENNEDSLRAEMEMNLFVLSDGMGGAASGEFASRLTVDTVVAYFRETQSNPSLPPFGQPIEGVTPMLNRLADGIRLANQVIYQSAQEDVLRQGMGATVVAVCCTGERVCLAHVGDSRVYLLRNGHLQQLTMDHSFIAETARMGETIPQGTPQSDLQALTRVVGVDAAVEVEVNEELLMDGDTVLLCSDGLTRELSDNQISAILREAKNTQEAADSLVLLANQAGGRDNISAIVLRLAPKTAGAFSRMSRLIKSFGERVGHS